MPNVDAQDAYYHARDWIIALESGWVFTRADLVAEMRWRYMYSADACNGPCNVAIRHCEQRDEIVAVPNDSMDENLSAKMFCGGSMGNIGVSEKTFMDIRMGSTGNGFADLLFDELKKYGRDIAIIDDFSGAVTQRINLQSS